MAFSLFGKKDKNPPEASAPVAKAPPAPPKIQTPPSSGPIPAVKPPQPSGLIPTSGLPAGTATTQPMVMPRGAAGLKPTRPGVAQSSRSTQRIVLPTSPSGGRPNITKPLSMGAPTGRINLPIGMILRCLPPEVLAADLSEFEASGTAATEIGLPMNMILSQLPSGKVEMALQDLVPHFPAGYLQPTESIVSYLPNLINLPLMDVVMRIPPDLLALRPDQKDVDAAVINMADPFTEEILREQAEAARRATQANIIDESQVPQTEEFVPRDQAGTPKTIAPPQRPPSMALPTPRPAFTAPQPPMPQTPGPRPSVPSAASGVRPPLPASPTPPTPPVASNVAARTISPSGRLSAPPSRGTTAIPTRTQGVVTPPIQVPSSIPSNLPTAPIPPVPRQTVSLPTPVRPPPPVAAMPPPPVIPAPIKAETPVPAPVEAPPVAPPPAVAVAPAAGNDDLQRLAALAMAQFGEDESAELPTTEAAAPEAEPEPASVPLAASIEEPAPDPEPVPETASEPPPEVPVAPVPIEAPAEETSVAEPMPPVSIAAEPEPEPEPVPEPKSAPVPEPVAELQPEAPAPPASASVAFNLNTCTVKDLVQNVPGCFPELAESIVAHRTKIGSFKRLEDLLDVPGITKAAYTNLTGEAPPDNKIPLSLSELLGFPAEQHITLKDVTDRISCWPDVTGCVLSQSSGLSLVGSVPEGLDKSAIVAFAPRMFDAINKSFSEITGNETDALILPTSGNSFHIFRNKELYLIILSRLPQMPERHMKVARFVLAALSVRRD